MTRGPAGRLGLRELKKQRTRQAIVDVSVRLFAQYGYAETTLVEIADAAEISPSTFFNYFPSKLDIVFDLLDAVIASARERILGRPNTEPATSAILAWITEDLASVERPYTEALRTIPMIVSSDANLRSEQRRRLALLEDVLAAAFARDLGELSDGLRARVMSVIAMRGMLDVWNSWHKQHASDSHLDLNDLLALKAEYLERALDAGLQAIELLPNPPEQT